VKAEEATPRKGPVLQVLGEMVTVDRCYDIKDSLRCRGFRWNALSRLWERSLREVLGTLQLTDSLGISLDAVLEVRASVRCCLSGSGGQFPSNRFACVLHQSD